MKIWIFHGDRKTDIKVWSQESLVIWTAANNSSGLEGGTLGMIADWGGWTCGREQGVCAHALPERLVRAPSNQCPSQCGDGVYEEKWTALPQRIGEPMVSWNSRLFSPEQGNDDFWDRRKADQVAGWEKSNDDFCFWCVDLKRNYPVVENVTTSRPCWTSFCETVPSFLTPCETYSNF